jgi:ABC-2 type transport system permease protein
MNLRRIAVLLRKEFTHGSKSFIFVFTVVMPLVLSLVVVLIFGDVFAGKPRLGFADEGNSEIVPLATAVEGLVVREYDSQAALKQAVEAGAVDAGVILPQDFDRLVKAGEKASLTAYVWGESLLKNRAFVVVTMTYLLRTLTGSEAPLEVVTALVGDGESIPWQQRLLPFIVLMATLLGGSMVPSTSLVEEKQKRTLKALVITPTTLGDVFAAKGLLGILLSYYGAIVVLLLNGGLGPQPVLLLGVLALGTIMASAFGLMLGAFIKDVDTLFAVIKGTGLLLYAPAIVYLFPAIPQWIGRIFPTYYLIAPVIEISQHGAIWSDVALDVLILTGLIVVMLGLVVLAVRRLSQQEI